MLQNEFQYRDFPEGKREQAKATARLISYAIREVEELELKECRQLLLLSNALIRKKYQLSPEEALSDDEL
jgi:hypothetical protein